MAAEESQISPTSASPSSPERTRASWGRLEPEATRPSARLPAAWKELPPDDDAGEPRGEEQMGETLTHKVADWCHKMEDLERQGEELTSCQWRLTRGQVNMITKGLSHVEKQILELRRDLTDGFRQATAKDSELMSMLLNLMAEEKAQRAEVRSEMRSLLWEEVKKLREERSADSAALRAAIAAEAAAREKGLAAAAQELASVKQVVRNLQDDLSAGVQEVHTAVEKEAEERKAGEDMLATGLRGAREEADKAAAANEKKAEAIRDLLTRKASEQAAQLQALEVKLGSVSAEVVSTRGVRDFEEAIQRRCRDLGEEVTSKFAEQQRAIDRVAADRQQGDLRMEQRVADLAQRVDEQATARKVMMEEVDATIERCRSALKGLIAKEAEATRMAMSALELEMREKVEKDAIRRVEQCSMEIQTQAAWRLTSERSVVELRRVLDDLATRMPTAQAVQELERSLRTWGEEFEIQLRDVKEQHRTDIAMERRVMEDAVATVEERHRAMVDTFLQEIGRKLLDNPLRRARRSGPAALANGEAAPVSEASPSSSNGSPPLPAPAVPPPPTMTQHPMQQAAVDIALDARSSRSVVSAPCPGPRRREEAVMISGHVARRAANGVYRPLRRRYMGAPVYFCKQANTYLFRSARNGSWGIGDKPSGALIALVQDGARVAGEIRGTWKVQAGAGGMSWVEDPHIALTRHGDQEHLGEAVAVSSHAGDFVGGYKKTKEHLHGAPVYLNKDAGTSMWFSGREWLISDHPGSGSASVRARSLEVSGYSPPPRPDAVAWKGAEVSPVEASESDPDDDDEELCGGSFIDEEFPPEDASIGADNCPAEWVRAAHLCTAQPRLFWRQDPGPLMRGAQGDCWLLSAIAAVAEFPGYLCNQVLKNQGISASGRYTVTLYDVGTAAWVDIVVDDLIPCRPKQWYERRAKPIFSQPHRNEMHALIIEKAFAKFAGCYQALAGGSESLAWIALVGQETQYCWDCYGDGSWVQKVLALDRRRHQPRSFNLASFEETGEEKRPEEMFEYLEDCIGRNYLVGAAIPGSGNRESRRTGGLVDTYAYPLLDCREVDGLSLVQLRNPWGQGQQWEGAWGPSSARWRERPTVARALGLQGEAAPRDAFWMEWEDFACTFKKIYVSPRDMRYPRAGRAGAVQLPDAPPRG